jgi:hypothetical protein
MSFNLLKWDIDLNSVCKSKDWDYFWHCTTHQRPSAIQQDTLELHVSNSMSFLLTGYALKIAATIVFMGAFSTKSKIPLRLSLAV